ncbi:peptidyl-prolyl cis-trans isomerase A (cyclophilin A) [Lampropedia hyalina DSM 16112]|jgi:peptidyl-prolyl cis-trans isomerase A (cyclophilin A)|uniref:Peptidyl-prolyl cis-trans isomerase n=1 Tax=Lampropedia hyalina DSM 16112 TaxID=1122156 RepID=A0A1M4VAH8_9BURK|nr:peptidyl-prolyl cis-trans isomerase A (cyclophilin A) [Lampropedia hyalina DSM 16112]
MSLFNSKRHTLHALLAVTLGGMCLPAVQAQSRAAAPQVKLHTSQGDIVLELNPEKAPQTVANFLQYVDDKHYDGTVFHRVIGNFMIQGGGFDANLVQKKTRPAIPLEAFNGLKNERGTIAMARTGAPHSATSQFFINVENNTSLNARSPRDGYAVFGKVVQGMDVVDAIRKVPTGRRGPHSDVPVEAVTILSASRVQP